MQTVRELLSRDLSQPIEEVIKLDQQDERTVHNEITEYVATDRIKGQYLTILQAIADAPPEAAAIRQQVDALEDAGLPRAIGTDEEIEPAARAQLDVDEVAQVAQLQPDQAHRTPSGKAERPDKAGRSCSTWNRGWITASAASRRGASARWPPRAPAPRSWRPAGPG